MNIQYFSTKDGVAKREGDHLRLLDVPASALGDALLSGSLDSLGDAPVLGTLALEDAVFLPPYQPKCVVLAGMNYKAHVEEGGQRVPDKILFLPPMPTAETIIASGDEILPLADNPDQLDFECEIAVIIGKEASNVSAADAWDYVSGVTAINDVTARDLQAQAAAAVNMKDGELTKEDLMNMAKSNMLASKMSPTFKPLGPGVLHPAEASQGDLHIRCFVNGELRQDGDTADMLFPIATIIEAVSAEYTLVPGDLVMTGTPAGVGLGDGRYLVEGDLVEIVLEDLPPLSNRVAAVPVLPA